MNQNQPSQYPVYPSFPQHYHSQSQHYTQHGPASSASSDPFRDPNNWKWTVVDEQVMDQYGRVTRKQVQKALYVGPSASQSQQAPGTPGVPLQRDHKRRPNGLIFLLIGAGLLPLLPGILLLLLVLTALLKAILPTLLVILVLVGGIAWWWKTQQRAKQSGFSVPPSGGPAQSQYPWEQDPWNTPTVSNLPVVQSRHRHSQGITLKYDDPDA